MIGFENVLDWCEVIVLRSKFYYLLSFSLDPEELPKKKFIIEPATVPSRNPKIISAISSLTTSVNVARKK